MVWSVDMHAFLNYKWFNSDFHEVVLPDGTRLEDRFNNWRDVLALRDATGSRDEIVDFHIGPVRFTLDVVEGTELETFDEDHIHVYDPDFLETDAHKNIVFFRPNGKGIHRNMLFRFTVGSNHLRYVDRRDAVLISFIRLLLAGRENFSDITYMVAPAFFGAANVHPTRYPGLPPATFPQLPLEDLLPRANYHEFIRLRFNQSSCEALESSASTVNKLSFAGCTFADEGKAVMHSLASSNELDSLELETLQGECLPLPSSSLSSTALLGIKSLTVCLSDLRSNETAASHLCGMAGLRHLRIVNRDGSNIGIIDKEFWTRFLNSKIRHHPSLKTLEFVMPDRRMATDLLEAMTEMVKRSDVTLLESVHLQENWANSCKADQRFEEVNHILTERLLSAALHQSSCRHALLPRVLAAKKTASRPDFAFALLKQNADVM